MAIVQIDLRVPAKEQFDAIVAHRLGPNCHAGLSEVSVADIEAASKAP